MDLSYSSRKYRQLVEWIAWNDAPGDHADLEALSGYLTVTMLAHVYKLPGVKVAGDVLAMRAKEVAR